MGAAAGPVGAGGVEVDVVAYGRPATNALAARLAASKQAHPLDPVTVVVPSNVAGLAARRVLATLPAGESGRSGLANVQFVTPFGLAELIGGPALAGRQPLTTPVLAAAVRRVLTDAPGMFAVVAGHDATHAAIIATYAELSRAGDAAHEAIAAASTRGAEVVRVVRAVGELLSGFYDEDTLAAAATARIASDPAAVAALGTVVWHLPGRATPAMTALIAAVLAAAPQAAAVVALTGNDGADAAVRRTCAAAGVDVPEVSPPIVVVHADRIISVTDADEEVRAVVREVLAQAEAGTALDRIAIAYPRRDPYARTLVEQLSAAGIPFTGPASTRVADSAPGRALLAVLSLPEQGWHRRDVIALAQGAPIWDPAANTRAHSSGWDNVSRQAGVVAGLDDWRTKLPGYRKSRVADLAEAEASDDPRREGRRFGIGRDIEAIDGVLAFVDDLAAGLDAIDAASGWTARVAATQTLLTTLVGPEHRHSSWPEAEIHAAQKIDAALTRLAALDAIEPEPSAAAFRLALTSELQERSRRHGRFGTGVLITPLAAAVGLDLDAIFVLGVVEGDCPWFRGEDSLLPDVDRERAAGELTTRADLLADQHRAFLAAVAAGFVHRTLVVPRGDLRSRRSRLPSRWALDTASHHAGRPVFSRDFARLEGGVLTVVPSYAAGLAAATTHGTVGERDTAALAVHVAARADVATHPLATGDLGRGIACVRARSGPEFTEWDGNLAGQPVPSPTAGMVLSASRLETWAKCPLKYFFAHVLHVNERDDPDRIDDIRADHKGTMIHTILERFVAEAIARPGGPPAPDEPWTDADRARMAEIAQEVFAETEAKGVTGRPLAWHRTRLDVLADLDRFITEDDGYRAREGMTPAAVEMAFGLDGNEPLSIVLPDGRELRFRGKIDRVDRAPDGRVSVLDYKSSKHDSYQGIDTDPVLEGTTLQLGIYALAALQHGHGVRVLAQFWLATSRGEFAMPGYDWDEERSERFLSVVGTMVDGIDTGVFPANPGEYEAFWGKHKNCTWCEYDRVCPRDRDDHQDAMAGAPELELLAQLLPSTPDTGDGE